MSCVVQAKYTPFTATLAKVADFIIMEFCHAPDIRDRYQPLLDDGRAFDKLLNGLPEEFRQPLHRIYERFHPAKGAMPIEDDSCLPLRIAESYEVAAIQTRKFSFDYHGPIGHAAHLIFTILGNYPFKVYEDCA